MSSCRNRQITLILLFKITIFIIYSKYAQYFHHLTGTCHIIIYIYKNLITDSVFVGIITSTNVSLYTIMMLTN